MANSTEVTSTSTQSVLTSLVSNGILFGAFFAGFLLFRLKFLRIYQPKSSFDLINDEKKPEPLPSGLYQWLLPLIKKSDNFIIRQAGLDGYFFLRYIGIIAALCLFFTLLYFPILLPINGTSGKGSTGLDQYTIANVGTKQRYYAHSILSVVFYLTVVYIIYRELIYYTSVRQAVLSSPRYGKKISSRVVLFQTVPEQYLSEVEFAKLFEDVKKVWISRGAADIADKVEARDDLAIKLENAENNLLKLAVKNKLKKDKKGDTVTVEDEITEYVPEKKRPTHRLKFLIGKKVDTINYALEELPKLNKEVNELQSKHHEAKPMNSVFVEFGSQYSAQLAYQSIAHHTPLHLAPRYIGLDPKDIIWINMRMLWWERLVRNFGAVSAIVALLIFWSIPVAFVGLISNITYLTNKLPWLDFIYKLPDELLGLITSMAPTIALALLMMLLPKYIRLMAKISGAPSVQHVEYFTQQAYFAFQVIQVFLITTIASSATSTVTQIAEDPTSAMYLLSENLPKASNFYIAYIILQGLTISAGILFQILNFVLFYVLGAILDGTPRKKWKRFTKLSSLSWGTVFPIYTNLAVITLTYAIISPFVLLFAAAGFGLLYIAYLYNLTYAYSEGPDSRGMHYPRALFQTFVGIYLGEICLLGLFVVSKAWGPIVIEAILIGITVFCHINLNAAFDSLINVLPVDTMRPLDGRSETPSYSFRNQANGNKRLSRDSYTTFDKTSNLRPDGIELDDLNELALENNRYGTTPLLADGDKSLIPPAPFYKRFFQPHIYASYKVAKTRIPDIYNFPDPTDPTDPDIIEHSYDFPAVSSKIPYLWIPRDPMGLSTVEINKFKGIIDISDEGAFFNEKGKIEWTGAPPSYDEAIATKPTIREDEDEDEEIHYNADNKV